MTTISAVIYPENDQWVGQCVEYDIGAQASSMDDLRERLEAAIFANLNESLRMSDVPFGGIDPAPEQFHKMLEQCAELPPIGSIEKDHVSVAMRLCKAA